MSAPVKHSFGFNGRKSSISLEPEFWELLCQHAALHEMTVGALIAEIDGDRDPRQNLSSAIRTTLLNWAMDPAWLRPDGSMAVLINVEGQFASYNHWVSTAQYVLGPRPGSICADMKGRICRVGADFMRARDEDAFPVRFGWPEDLLANERRVA